jgi:hypothetical protein
LVADGVDPLDGDAVRQWITANADDYARGEGAPSATEPTSTPDPNATLADEYARLNVGAHFAQPVSLEKHDAVFARITPDMTQDDVAALLREAGL